MSAFEPRHLVPAHSADPARLILDEFRKIGGPQCDVLMIELPVGTIISHPCAKGTITYKLDELPSHGLGGLLIVPRREQASEGGAQSCTP